MSLLDTTFVNNCCNILLYGSTDEGLLTRSHWPDGTLAHTKMIFNECDKYPLRKDSIPVMTLRKLNFKACVDEILWIYQRTSNNIRDLHSSIWDAWADKNGSIGRAYGYQIAQRFRHHIYTPGEDLSDYPSAHVFNERKSAIDFGYEVEATEDVDWVWMNQIDAIIWSLRNNPTDRGIITNMYNHQDLADMGLRPCAYSMTFNVEHWNGKRYLHGLLNQRSQDMLTANGWNVTQYAVLLQMIAQVCGMEPGVLTHMVANMHIYDRHEEIVKDLIAAADNLEYYANPEFWINPDIHSFKDFTVDDVKLIDYFYRDVKYEIEIAV